MLPVTKGTPTYLQRGVGIRDLTNGDSKRLNPRPRIAGGLQAHGVQLFHQIRSRQPLRWRTCLSTLKAIVRQKTHMTTQVGLHITRRLLGQSQAQAAQNHHTDP